jgi:hypothetical protein
MLADFIFQDILCRWGTIQTIVTDNGKPFITALNSLAKWYSINHIHISGYNAQANSLIKHKPWELWQALYKVTNGVEPKWYWGFYATLWAIHITPRQTMGYSPYFATHSLHPILPFNINKATYLLPPPHKILTTKDLIIHRACQLQHWLTDIDNLCKWQPLQESPSSLSRKYASLCTQAPDKNQKLQVHLWQPCFGM